MTEVMKIALNREAVWLVLVSYHPSWERYNVLQNHTKNLKFNEENTSFSHFSPQTERTAISQPFCSESFWMKRSLSGKLTLQVKLCMCPKWDERCREFLKNTSGSEHHENDLLNCCFESEGDFATDWILPVRASLKEKRELKSITLESAIYLQNAQYI